MMQSTNRIIFNTVILYVKIILCMAIALWTVPLVLHALGKSDYGLYNLVAGVIVMLSFLNGAMTISTQRFLSVTIGEGNEKKLLQVYNLSVLLHIIIGVMVIVIVESLAPVLFEYVLKIDRERADTAYQLFHFLVVSMFFTILIVPFDAVLNAYENMMVFSVVGVIEALMKLCVALLLPYVLCDKLQFYGIAMMSITMMAFLMKMSYTIIHYRQLRFSKEACRNKTLFWEMFGFAGWNTISSMAIMVRNQGMAVVLNHFFGTIVNAAYGIGNQINGVLGYFSTTIQKSVNPQLMQSQGSQNHEKLMLMTFSLTKFSTLCMGLVAIPLLVEMPYVLKLWLTVVPEDTISISRFIIILSLLFQLSSGLMSAIQSTGKIKYYTTCMGLLLISTIPIAYAVLWAGAKAYSVLCVACAIEIGVMSVRLCFAHHLVQLPVMQYIRTLIVPITSLIAGMSLGLYMFTLIVPESFARLIVVGFLDVFVFCAIVYNFMLNTEEQMKVNSLVAKLTQRRK